MAGAADLTTSAAILKQLYQNGDVPQELYRNNNFVQWVPKQENFKGKPEIIAVNTETTQGGSANFTSALANLKGGAYSQFQVNRVKDYSIARIDGEAYLAADGDSGSLVNLWKREMDLAMLAGVRQLGIMAFRSGTGSRGRISAGSNVATNQVTLATISDITNFAIGMPVNASAADGGATRNASAVEVIAGIDRVNGTLTSTSVTWATVIAAIAASDFLYRNGDAANGGTNVTFTGMGGWIPGGTTPGTLFSLNRNTDPVALAGQLFNASAFPIEEAVIEAIARTGVEGGQPDTIILHPREKATLVKSLETKTRYNKEGTAKLAQHDAAVGFDVVEFESDYGGISIISDMNCPRNSGWLLQKDTWFLGSIGKAPRIQDFDSLQMIRVSTEDSLEVRIFTYGQFVCRAPRWNTQISNLGT